MEIEILWTIISVLQQEKVMICVEDKESYMKKNKWRGFYILDDFIQIF
jgi:hypothetical protein